MQQRAATMRGWHRGIAAGLALAAGLWLSAVQAQLPFNQPPSVSLSAAPTSISMGASTVLTATATDLDGSVARVVPLPRFASTLPEFRRHDSANAAALNAAWENLRLRAGREDTPRPSGSSSGA